MTRENHTAANSDARKREAERLAEVPTIEAVLSEHAIECTGLGEVTCGGCRERGWMSWTEHRAHVADAIRQAGAR